METTPSHRLIAKGYLLLVPIISAVLGFAVGPVRPAAYVPIWLLNVILMAWACRTLGRKVGMASLVACTTLLIAPWMLISMFAGMGPPPETPALWAATGTEQTIRYSMLVVAGTLLLFGIVLLSRLLRQAGEERLADAGASAMYAAYPIFAINMLFWGFFLTAAFRLVTRAGDEMMPEWLGPVRALFGGLSIVGVSLIYLATAFLATALRRCKAVRSWAGHTYLGVSLLALIVLVLSAFLPEPFVTAGFIVSIPASPFVMPYYLGVNLLARGDLRQLPAEQAGL